MENIKVQIEKYFSILSNQIYFMVEQIMSEEDKKKVKHFDDAMDRKKWTKVFYNGKEVKVKK